MHLFNFVSNLVQVGLRFVIELDLHSVNGVGICDKVRDTWRYAPIRLHIERCVCLFQMVISLLLLQ